MIQQGKYKVECSKCKSSFEIEITGEDIKNLEEVENQEREMGVETHYRLLKETSCDSCNHSSQKVEIWEYPQGGYHIEQIKE